jgi:hypothetical protein
MVLAYSTLLGTRSASPRSPSIHVSNVSPTVSGSPPNPNTTQAHHAAIMALPRLPKPNEPPCESFDLTRDCTFRNFAACQIAVFPGILRVRRFSVSPRGPS